MGDPCIFFLSPHQGKLGIGKQKTEQAGDRHERWTTVSNANVPTRPGSNVHVQMLRMTPAAGLLLEFGQGSQGTQKHPSGSPQYERACRVHAVHVRRMGMFTESRFNLRG